MWNTDLRKINTLNTHTKVIRTLGTETEHYRSAAQCVAYIAATEIPQNLWPEVIPTLVANVTNMQATEALKESSLEALGYICEELVSINVNVHVYTSLGKLSEFIRFINP